MTVTTQANGRLLVAVDVDGTLLDTEFEDVLRPREISALQAVRAAGHVVALCTGRNLNSTRGLLEKSGWFPEDLPMVLLNGAVVWGDMPRRKLSSKELDRVQIRRLVEAGHGRGTIRTGTEHRRIGRSTADPQGPRRNAGGPERRTGRRFRLEETR